MEIPELKNTVSQFKNWLDELNGKLETKKKKSINLKLQ